MKTIGLTKSIGYAYASSSNAKRFGFERTGCHVVYTYGNGSTVEMAGFATKEQAEKFADSLPFPSHKFTN